MVNPQTNEDLMRECLGSISRAAERVMGDAMDWNTQALKVHFLALKSQMDRLELLEKNIPRKRVKI